MNDINLYPFSTERKSNDIIKMPDNKIPGTDSFDIKNDAFESNKHAIIM